MVFIRSRVQMLSRKLSEHKLLLVSIMFQWYLLSTRKNKSTPSILTLCFCSVYQINLWLNYKNIEMHVHLRSGFYEQIGPGLILCHSAFAIGLDSIKCPHITDCFWWVIELIVIVASRRHTQNSIKRRTGRTRRSVIPLYRSSPALQSSLPPIYHPRIRALSKSKIQEI